MDKKGRAEKRGAGRNCGAATVLMKSVLLAFLVSVFGVLVVSVFVSKSILPEGGMVGCTALACVMGTLIGGLYGVRKIGKKTLVVGMGIGALLFLVLGVIGTLWSGGEAEWGSNAALIIGSCLCGGGMSGVLGGVPGKRRH